jgi:hypothetical protein
VKLLPAAGAGWEGSIWLKTNRDEKLGKNAAQQGLFPFCLYSTEETHERVLQKQLKTPFTTK